MNSLPLDYDEDRHYRELLQQHEQCEAEEEAKIEEMVRLTMQEGEEFFPFEVDNLREAMTEILATSDGIETLKVLMEAAAQDKVADNALVRFGLYKLAKEVVFYWFNIAQTVAEREAADD